MKMWLVIFTILSYICFGFMLDVTTQSLGKKELKDADRLINIQLEINILKENYHRLLFRVQRVENESDLLKKQNQDLKQKLDNTVNKTDALINKDESFDKSIGVLQGVTLQHQGELYEIRKSRISVSSSMTILNISLQELMKHHSNVSNGLIAKEKRKIFEKKIKDENDKVIGKIESAMDSFMKNVSFNNKLVTDRLQKMTEDAVKLTTRVTNHESSTDKIEKTVSDVEELKANDIALETFMKHMSFNITLLTSKCKQMTEDATITKTKVNKLESSTDTLLSNLTVMSSQIEMTFKDIEELNLHKLSCRPERFTCTKQFQCIPATSRCNVVVDCHDKSDEEGCDSMCYKGGVWQKKDESNICVCTAGFLGKQCEYSDGKDTSFMVIFQEGIFYYPTTPKILVASENTIRLSIRYFNENKIHTITMDKSNTEYNLSKSVLPSDGIHMAGVELHSDKGINVYGFSLGTDVSEGYSSMPTRFASTKYIIPTLPAFITRYKNMIALTPCYQNTVVSINLKLKSGSITYDNKQYGNNDTIRIMVNKYDTFQLSTSSDLSGTMVTSSKPIIVVSGNQCNTAVPDNISLGSCNPFIESVLPTDQLDDMFITPYTSTRLNNTVRIQAVNSTNLTIKTDNKTISKTLNARDFFDFYYNTISFISSSEDILVTSYPHGLSTGKGDPFMMTIPGVNQYLYEYDFVVPTGFDSYISITVQSDATDGLFLDGNSSRSQSSVFSISEGMNNFSTFSLPISAGLHRIEHKKKVRFGLWIYGNGDFVDGYGYPAGMAYKAYN
ncbi:uncharacterized protein [Mytilus edulis]|uniref:uncharacterized protein isoform X2 n=1 Tax=Mytilus edulis TaxID=6550 RepID=UPI0039EF837A